MIFKTDKHPHHANCCDGWSMIPLAVTKPRPVRTAVKNSRVASIFVLTCIQHRFDLADFPWNSCVRTLAPFRRSSDSAFIKRNRNCIHDRKCKKVFTTHQVDSFSCQRQAAYCLVFADAVGGNR